MNVLKWLLILIWKIWMSSIEYIRLDEICCYCSLFCQSRRVHRTALNIITLVIICACIQSGAKIFIVLRIKFEFLAACKCMENIVSCREWENWYVMNHVNEHWKCAPTASKQNTHVIHLYVIYILYNTYGYVVCTLHITLTACVGLSRFGIVHSTTTITTQSYVTTEWIVIFHSTNRINMCLLEVIWHNLRSNTCLPIVGT